MQYAILCYDSESLVGSWSQQKDDALMVRLGKIQDGLDAQGKLGPVARLLPTTAAVTVRPAARSRWSSTVRSRKRRSNCSVSTWSIAIRSRK